MTYSPPSTVKRKIKASIIYAASPSKKDMFMTSLRKVKGRLNFNNKSNRYAKIEGPEKKNNQDSEELYEYMGALSKKEIKKITKRRKALEKRRNALEKRRNALEKKRTKKAMRKSKKAMRKSTSKRI